MCLRVSQSMYPNEDRCHVTLFHLSAAELTANKPETEIFLSIIDVWKTLFREAQSNEKLPRVFLEYAPKGNTEVNLFFYLPFYFLDHPPFISGSCASTLQTSALAS